MAALGRVGLLHLTNAGFFFLLIDLLSEYRGSTMKVGCPVRPDSARRVVVYTVIPGKIKTTKRPNSVRNLDVGMDTEDCTVTKTNHFCKIKKLGAHTMIQILDICVYFKRTWTDYKTGSEGVAIRSHIRFFYLSILKENQKGEGAESLEPSLTRSGSGSDVSSAISTSCLQGKNFENDSNFTVNREPYDI